MTNYIRKELFCDEKECSTKNFFNFYGTDYSLQQFSNGCKRKQQ